jgi:hypothetical protein
MLINQYAKPASHYQVCEPGNISLKPPKRWLFCPKFPKKPSRRRNKLAELASKALVMAILSAKV